MTWDPADTAREGAILLDEEKPGWAERIDLSTLRMESCRFCILGQLYGDYVTGCNELDPDEYEQPSWDPVEYGFDAGPRERYEQDRYARLVAAWTGEINARLTGITPA